MFVLEFLLLMSIYSNLKFKVFCKNTDFECRYIKSHIKEKLQFLSMHLPFCLFIRKKQTNKQNKTEQILKLNDNHGYFAILIFIKSLNAD